MNRIAYMHITLNGQKAELKSSLTVEKLIDNSGFRDKPLAVELNGELLSKDLYATTLIRENDRVEIVTFVGGG